MSNLEHAENALEQLRIKMKATFPKRADIIDIYIDGALDNAHDGDSEDRQAYIECAQTMTPDQMKMALDEEEDYINHDID